MSRRTVRSFSGRTAVGPEPFSRSIVPPNIESFWPQRSLLPKGGDQSRAAAHATQRTARSFTELVVILGTNVRQFVLLPVSPDEFHRVQFGRVGRQVLLVNPAFEIGNIVLDQSAADAPATGPTPPAGANAGAAPRLGESPALAPSSPHRDTGESRSSTP